MTYSRNILHVIAQYHVVVNHQCITAAIIPPLAGAMPPKYALAEATNVDDSDGIL